MGHSGAGSGCIGCCWKPSQPRAIMVNKLSWGLATETTHWRAAFFSTAGLLSGKPAALEYGLKQGLILILAMQLLRADQRVAKRKLENDAWEDWLTTSFSVCPCTDVGLLLLCVCVSSSLPTFPIIWLSIVLQTNLKQLVLCDPSVSVSILDITVLKTRWFDMLHHVSLTKIRADSRLTVMWLLMSS